MKLRMQLNEAFVNLMSSKLRSFLALLGVLVGTASVVAMVSGGNLATQAALKELTRLGTNLLSVSIYTQDSQKQTSQNQPQPIELNAVLKIPEKIPAVTAVGPYTQVYLPINYEGHQVNGSVIGVTQDLMSIVQIHLLYGRFISNLDDYQLQCVVGNTLYKDIRQYTHEGLIGKQIQIGNQFCTVVGVLKPWTPNSFMYTDINEALVIPIKASTLLSKYANVNNIVFRLQKGSDIQVLQKQVSQYVLQHSIGMHLFFMSPEQLIKSAQKQSDILTLFLAFIGSISLLVGGIGVMNIMLVSVVERRREIGIRKAVGAQSRDIVSLFLIESIVLSLTGGVLGVILGVVASYIIALYKHWAFTIFFLPIVAGFIVSVFCGIFFGLYPAYKASKLDPIVALHSD